MANSTDFNANVDYSLLIQKKTESSPIHALQYIELPSHTGTYYRIVSDVSLLFNQKRIASTIGIDEANNWLKSLNQSSSENLGDKFTDEQLISLVKSRHVQSPSDLRSWSNFLTKQAQDIQDFVDLNVKYNYKQKENAQTT